MRLAGRWASRGAWAVLAVAFLHATLLATSAAAEDVEASAAAAEAGECDATAGGECAGGNGNKPVGTALEQEGNDSDGNSSHFVNGTRKKGKPLNFQDLGFWRISLVLSLLGGVLLWILMTIKFAIDGSLPARLAMWGFLPEAYAAISVSSVVALLRLKSNPTPVIVLRNCVDDVGAAQLAEAVSLYNKVADLEALELPHNLKCGQAGVRSLVSIALAEGSTLQELDLSYNPHFGPFIVTEIRPLLPAKASKVFTLKLADCGITKEELQKLADGMKNTGLRTLDLSMNPLSGCGELLASMCEAGALMDEIALGRCGLSTEDVSLIAENLPYTSIKSIQLGYNRLGKAGLDALVEHLPSCQIDELGLEANNLEISDLDSLGMAWVKRPFSRVKLSGNKMTNEDIAQFVGTLKSMHA